MAERFTAAQADLEWRANTGRVEADVTSLRREFHASTEAMGDDALRLAVAQDRLDKALLRHGPASTQAKQAELSYRREVQASTTAARRYDVEIDRNTRSLERFSRGALAGSGTLRGLRGAVAFASAGFLGGAGLVYGFRQAIAVSSNLEEQISKTEQVFESSADGVIRWSTTTSTAMGVAQDAALAAASTYGLLFRNIGEGPEEAARLSQSLVQLASDLASFNNTSTEDALNAIRSGLTGEIEPLRRYGVFLSEARARTQALADTNKKSATELTTGEKVLARYKLLLEDTQRAQGDYTRTADGTANSERTLHALWRESQQIIGQALSPSYTDVVQGLRDWLSEDENRIALQRDVNQVVRDGTQVVRGLVRGIRLIGEVTEPVVDALGGLANAVEIALIVGLVAKARRAAAGLGLIAAASAATRTKVVADAAAMGTALDIATRPRNIVITSTGAGTGTGTSTGRGKGGGGGVLGKVARAAPFILSGAFLTSPTAIIAEVIALGAKGAGTTRGDRSDRYPNVYAAVSRAAAGVASDRELEILRDELGSYSLANAPDSRMAAAERRLKALAVSTPTRPDDRGEPRGPGSIAGAGSPSGGGGRGGAGPRRSELDIEIDLARAQSTPGTSDDLRFLNEQKALYARQIRALETRRKLTDDQKERLRELYGAIASTQGQIDSIVSSNETEAADRAKEIEDRRREQLDAREQSLENRLGTAQLTESDADDRRALQALVEFYRRQARNDDLTLKERRAYESKRVEKRRELAKLDADQRRDRVDAKEERLKNAVEAAELTETLADDRRQLERLIAFYRQLARNDDIAAKERREYVQRRIAAQKALKGLEDGTSSSSTASFEQKAFEFLQTLQGFTNQFGSNVLAGDRPPLHVEVNQTFPAPTQDRNMEALYMRHAVERAFEAV